MIRTSIIFLTALVGLWTPVAQAKGYEVELPDAFYADSLATLYLTAEKRITLRGEMPDSAGVRILDYQEILKRPNSPYTLEIVIMPLRPGRCELPPISITVDGRPELFLCPAFEALENPTPSDISQIVLFWNGEADIPEQLWHGQQVDLDILQVSSLSLYNAQFTLPIVKLTGGDLRLYPDRFSLKPTPFVALGSSLFKQRVVRSKKSYSTLRGQKVSVNRSKVLFTVDEESSEVALSIASSVGKRNQPNRALLSRTRIPTSPLPPLPADLGPFCGLVGNWKISGRTEPENPKKNKPFKIIIDLEGRGTPRDFIKPDFSSADFRTIESKLVEAKDSKTDYYRGSYTQLLMPLSDEAVFPSQRLASFNTTKGVWQSHSVIEGFGDSSVTKTPPTFPLRPLVARPLFLNVSPYWFGMAALAPLLPLLVTLSRFFRKQMGSEANKRKRLLRVLIADLEKSKESATDTDATVFDQQVLPQLRTCLGLPPGASATDIATELSPRHPELADYLSRLANSSFGSQPEPFRPHRLASLLKPLLCLLLACLFTLPRAQASAQPESPALVEAKQLLAAEPNQPAHYSRLARTLLDERQPHRARAICHRLLLLDPHYPEGKALMREIRLQLGEPPTEGLFAFSFRPDQLATIALVGWIFTFLFLSLRILVNRLPLWPLLVLSALTVLAGAAAAWRYSSAYAPGRYMVATSELALQAEPGRLALDVPPLRSGEIIVATPSESQPETHLQFQLAEETYFLPLSSLEPVW